MRILGRDGIRPRSIVLATVGAVFVVLLILSSFGLFTSTQVPKGTVVTSIATSRYGPVLVVGGSSSSGLYRDPLYEFSGDVGRHLGCGTTRVRGYDLGATESLPLTCTGPEGDYLADVSSDDWPALTSKTAPVAGRGVDAKLLGTIFRRGIGHQVTYAGHPLYLFDPSSSPFDPQGENFMETAKPLPPWHGFWYLVSAGTGAPSPGVATIDTETLPNGQRALSVIEDGNVDPIEVTVYAGANKNSGCTATCSSGWTPVLSSARPHLGAGVDGARVGIVAVGRGLFDVTYDGRTLYLYDDEEILFGANDRLVSGGSSGNGTTRFGPDGVMSTVDPTGSRVR